jgi:uncharacterized repeat protein (TIGR01451 family)
MKKAVFYSFVALALVLGLILPIALPAMASESLPSKHRVPDEAPYDVGDTIHYAMSVTNPGTNTATNTYTRIWDTLPDGTVIEFLGVAQTLVLDPGESAAFNASYVVRAVDLEWIVPPVGEPFWGVRNVFQAEGYDSVPEDIDDQVEDVAEVIAPPPVGGEAFPIGKLSILAPWIALGAAIVAGAAVFARRRHHVQS